MTPTVLPIIVIGANKAAMSRSNKIYFLVLNSSSMKDKRNLMKLSPKMREHEKGILSYMLNLRM